MIESATLQLSAQNGRESRVYYTLEIVGDEFLTAIDGYDKFHANQLGDHSIC